ncbi:hypothetical protein H696_01346 [Fonticula alba]|uniref:CS domain-containing protein n=1 Tax=Fonticula alba TaxID=691883 RepID=A0A058ZEQ7_FONAL|nr:hypothetical protein H696_01346 [Fonticula alba]KCV71937.1 hypothetical protein H696_01346 [Fonticula alba]|eukprot:XP_009493515.1 hypothetical protein H696_01346 [Fonticula alba]
MATFTPTVLWAQRNNLIYLTVDVPDIDTNTDDIIITEDKIDFRVTGSGGKVYAFTIEFFAQVNPDECTREITGRHAFFTISKKADGFWDRLNKGSAKLPFVKTDFARWVDEDESDDEPDFPGAGGMGGFGGAGGFGGMGGAGGGMGDVDMAALLSQLQQGGGGMGGFPGMGDE